MPDTPQPLIGRNFLLKRDCDHFYLPCETVITGAVPSGFAIQAYLLCRTARYDPATGVLFLDPPTDFGKYDQAKFNVSVQENSQIIQEAGVRSFVLLASQGGATSLPAAYDWGQINEIDWTPLPQAREQQEDRAKQAPVLPRHSITNQVWSIAIDTITFADKKLSFTKFMYPTLGDVDFDIAYPASRKEFDAVKDIFATILRSKTVDFIVNLESVGPAIETKDARLVNPAVFDMALIEKVDDLIIRRTLEEIGEGIFLIEDIVKGTVSQTEKDKDLNWLLDKLNKRKKSKHYDHLRHLASLHDAHTFRLRMMANPISFLFVLKGAANCYLVWETYETKEATYIWQLQGPDSRSRQEEMKELLKKIIWLREANKLTYIRENHPHLTRLDHEYTTDKTGLEKWKTQLQAVIT
jgi:hypothetical protein